MRMPYVSIVGAAGYTGQETLDRVLAHPELELYALGSDSLAGQDATRSTRGSTGTAASASRGFITNDAALACGADADVPLPLARGGGRARAAVARRRGRPLRRPPARRRRPRTRRGTASTHPAPGRARRLVVRAPRAVAARRAADREPGLLRDRGRCSRSRPIADAIEPGERRRRRDVGDDGRGAGAEALVARGRRARERLAVQGRRAPARARDRAAARLPRLRSCPTCCRSGAGCSRPATSARPGADLRALLEERYAASPVVDGAAGGRRARARPRPAAPTAPRSASSTTAAPDRTIVDLRARQPRQGRRRPGGPERQPALRLRRDGRAPARRSARLMSVTAAAGFVACGVARRDPAVREAGPRARPLDRARRRRARCGRRTASRRRPSSSRGATSSSREPQAVVVNAGVANAATGARGERGRRARPRPRRRGCSSSAPEEVVVLSTGVIGVRAADGEAARRRRRGGRRALRRTAVPTRRRRSSRPTRGPKQAVAHRRRVHRRRDGEGRRDDPSRASRRCSRSSRPTTRSSPGEADRRSCAPPSSASFNRISVDGECSTNDAVVLLANGASGDRARRRRRDEQFAAALGEVCADARAADRRGRRGRDRAARDRRVAAPPRRRRRRRSRGASRPRRSSRPPPSAATRTGAACSPPPARRRGTAASRTLDPERLDVSLRRHARLRRRRADRARARARRRRRAGSSSTSGSATARRAYLASDLSYDYVRLNAEYTT